MRLRKKGWPGRYTYAYHCLVAHQHIGMLTSSNTFATCTLAAVFVSREEHIASNTRGAGQKKKRRELMPTLDQLVQAQTGAAAASTSAQAAHRALSGVIDTIEGFD